ncbi:MAG: hypothetical protein U9N32_06125 [Spirochaetota bacterium]|nr:hypothetical protein [Spirochaetota bacterium]
MKRIKFFITPLVLVILMVTGCASILDAVLSDTQTSPVVKQSSDPLDGYVFAYIENYPGGYHVATLIKPASSSTKNEAEILDLGEGGSKKWAKVFTSHPADKEELTPGEVVLVQGTGFSNPDKDELLATIWDAYYITDISDLFKGEIKAGNKTVPIKHLRIPDTEIVTN